MPIKRIEQPKIINIDKGLRLRAFDGNYSFAAVWYNNPNTVLLVDGVFEPYSKEQLALMYDVLNKRSEVYFIEVKKENRFVPIGDVAFCKKDFNIVIGDEKYRRKGIGKKVITSLAKRAKNIGYKKLFVREIFDFNVASLACFAACGFVPRKKTKKGVSFVLDLKKNQN